MYTGKDTLNRLYDLVMKYAPKDKNILEFLDTVGSLISISNFTNSLEFVELPCSVRGMPAMSQGFIGESTLFISDDKVYADGAQHVFSPSKAHDGCVLIYRDMDGNYFADFYDCDISKLQHRKASSFDVVISKIDREKV